MSETRALGSQSSHLPVLREEDQRDTCTITLLVVGILVSIAAISVGTAGLMNAIPLDRAASLSILIGGSIIGSSLIMYSTYHLISGVPSVASHNNSGKSRVQGIRAGVKHAQQYTAESRTAIFKSGWKERIVAKYTVTKQNVDSICDTINAAIDDYTQRAISVSLQTQGSIDRGNGKIGVRLVTLVKE